MKSYRSSDTELEAHMIGGALTFLFDDNAEFFKDRNPAPARPTADM
jgi:hypothetical protein